MKKIFNNSRLIAIAFFTVFTATAAPSAFANSNKDLPIELKFIGNMNNQSIFQLIVSDIPGNNDYTIIIRDNYGNPVYQDNIKAESFSKKFLFDTDELGDNTLLFEVLNRKTNQTVKYSIGRKTRVVEEMTVSNL